LYVHLLKSITWNHTGAIAMTSMMTRSIDDIYSYEKQALDLIDKDHPHYDEIKKLLIQQVNDEIHDHFHSKESDK